ncbi:rhomboid family intramembrane serine protease [Flammeovirgaceae bacterium SG7u.111]|nr:rhomboid family intramembrane serine protease [Flammeovirgaceae bacterium SG7u.132]WPO35760.1 rhomboid family intramembrane serine protease [Flammeovirgaceae bacterium SG7u.111]
MFGRITPVVKNLLIVNVVILIVQQFMQIDMSGMFGYRYPFADTFQPFQIFTYMFVHADFWHLFSNMFALFIFGPMLEQTFGSNRFLVFYLITGLGGGLIFGIVNFIEIQQMESAIVSFSQVPSSDTLLSFALDYAPRLTEEGYTFVYETFPSNPDNAMYIERAENFMSQIYQRAANMPMVGASGAVFGILMAFGMLFPNLQLMLLFPPIPIKAKYLVTFYGLYEVYNTIKVSPDDNVAHIAHLGGMAFAFLLLKIWKIQSPYR